MIFIGTLSYSLSFYFFTGLQRTAGHFFFYLLASQLNTMVSAVFVQMISAIFSRADTGGVVYTSAVVILITAGGFLIPYKEIPWAVRWISWLSYPRYFIDAVAASEFPGTSYTCPGNSALVVPINGTGALAYCDVAIRYALLPATKCFKYADFVIS